MAKNTSYNTVAPVAPDGGYGWVIVICAFFCIFVVDGACYSFGLYINEIADHFNITLGIAAIPGAIIHAMSLLMGPIAGAGVNRFGARLVVVAGVVIATCGLFFCIFTNNFTYFCILYAFCGGFGLCLLYLPVIVHVGVFFDKKRALATGLALAGSGIGTAFVSFLSPFLISRYTWQGTQWIIAGLVLQCMVCAVLLRPLSSGKSAPLILEEKKEHKELDNWTLLKDPVMVLNIASNFIGCLAVNIPIVYTASRVLAIGASKNQAGVLLTVYGLSSTLGRILVGYLADNTRLTALSITAIGMIICAGLTVLSTLMYNYYLFLAYLGVYGICLAAFLSLQSIVAVDYHGLDNLNNSYGLILMSRGLSVCMGSPIGGALYHATGSFSVMYYYAGLLMLVSAGAALLLPVMSRRMIRRSEDNNMTLVSSIELRTDRPNEHDTFNDLKCPTLPVASLRDS